MTEKTQLTGKSPGKHLMALLTFLALLPLVFYIPPLVAEWVTDNHLWVTVISVAVIVPVISYVALPMMVFVVLQLRKK